MQIAEDVEHFSPKPNNKDSQSRKQKKGKVSHTYNAILRKLRSLVGPRVRDRVRSARAVR